MKDNRFNLIWVDLEMTGLDCSRDYIIEIATIVTNKELEIISEGPALAIYQPPEVLAQMDNWNKKHHAASGLLAAVKRSRINTAEAERQTLAFLKEHADKRDSPMCGNTICQDRRFLARLMPQLEKFFHYRNLDVSSLKELALRWAPKMVYRKDVSSHRALPDIRGSIAELKHYREHFIQQHLLPNQAEDQQATDQVAGSQTKTHSNDGG